VGETCTATAVALAVAASVGARAGLAVGDGTGLAVGVAGTLVGGGGDGRAVGATVGAAVGGGGVGGGGVGAGVAAPSTFTVPRIVDGWTAQKYPNVPAVVMTADREPVEKTPVSNEPLSARAECGMPSSFVQVTLSPTFTVTALGANCAPRMATPAFAAIAAFPSAIAPISAAIANTRRAIRSH
jgi:hypothetical protein